MQAAFESGTFAAAEAPLLGQSLNPPRRPKAFHFLEQDTE
jgi:hypothetical protein